MTDLAPGHISVQYLLEPGSLKQAIVTLTLERVPVPPARRQS